MVLKEKPLLLEIKNYQSDDRKQELITFNNYLCKLYYK